MPAPPSMPPEPQPRRRGAGPLLTAAGGARGISTGALRLLAWLYIAGGALEMMAGAVLLVFAIAAAESKNAAAFMQAGWGIGLLIAGLIQIGLGEAARVLVELERRTRPG